MKNVFITGSTENTGFAVARHFASQGYNVIVSSRNLEKAQETAKKLSQEFGTDCMGVQLDLLNVADIQRVFDEIENKYGSLSVFVANSANLGIGNYCLDTTPEIFDSIMDVNAKGTFFCCQAAAKIMMKNGGGNIVTIGSVQSKGGVPGRCIYSMSKAAMSAMVKNMAYEFGQYGIRVNNIVAGAIHSTRWDGLSDEEIANRRSKYPVGKESSEQDIANAVYFLASDMSATVTGTDLVVDSGLLSCLTPYSKIEN